jgi:hypothetical protein
MPYTVNGIGTSICPGRGFAKWGGTADSDALECLTIFYVPILPFKAIHAFHWAGNIYSHVPIRWSVGLLVHAFGRRWLGVLLVTAIVAAVVGAVEFFNPRSRNPSLAIALFNLSWVLAVASALGWGLLEMLDRRTRSIRLLLGRHHYGSSDPATWTESLLATLAGPQSLFDAATYADAVLPLLDAGHFSQAMWAARLSAACENAATGEQLTNAILDYPGVADAVRAVHQSPESWAGIMQMGAGAALPLRTLGISATE